MTFFRQPLSSQRNWNGQHKNFVSKKYNLCCDEIRVMCRCQQPNKNTKYQPENSTIRDNGDTKLEKFFPLSEKSFSLLVNHDVKMEVKKEKNFISFPFSTIKEEIITR